MDAERTAATARALAHPARVRILELLASQTECRGAELFSEIPLAQSTISEHLRVLKEAGLLSSRPFGTAMTYCLSRGPLDELLAGLDGLLGEHATEVTCTDAHHCDSD